MQDLTSGAGGEQARKVGQASPSHESRLRERTGEASAAVEL